MVDVDGSFFDFRTARPLSPGQDPLIDTNLCVADQRRSLSEVLTLTGTSGVSMTLSTTEPGVQIYDGERFDNGGVPGHDGQKNLPYCGLAIEAQGWPDAPNHRHFPSIALAAGHAYEQVTQFRFARG